MLLIASVRALPLDRRASKANSTSPKTRDLSIRRARQMGISILTSPGSSSRDTGSKGVVRSGTDVCAVLFPCDWLITSYVFGFMSLSAIVLFFSFLCSHIYIPHSLSVSRIIHTPVSSSPHPFCTYVYWHFGSRRQKVSCTLNKNQPDEPANEPMIDDPFFHPMLQCCSIPHHRHELIFGANTLKILIGQGTSRIGNWVGSVIFGFADRLPNASLWKVNCLFASEKDLEDIVVRLSRQCFAFLHGPRLSAFPSIVDRLAMLYCLVVFQKDIKGVAFATGTKTSPDYRESSEHANDIPMVNIRQMDQAVRYVQMTRI
jgi:hypothetical protein